MFINGHLFPITLLNVSSFTSNSYFVSINSVSIIRSCRVVTIQMNLVLTNSAEETEAASEVVLDAFTQTVWWSWGAINVIFILITRFVQKRVLIQYQNIALLLTHNSSAVALIRTIFISEIEQKQSIFCLKSKSLHFNFLFIKILLYKISVTLQWCFFTASIYASILFCELLCVCCLSLWLFRPHLVWHKYIISRRLHWMQLKLESFSCEMTCECAHGCVTSLPVPLAMKGSARNRQDVRPTDPGR